MSDLAIKRSAQDNTPPGIGRYRRTVLWLSGGWPAIAGDSVIHTWSPRIQ